MARQEQAARTRDALLDAAAAEFARRGFEGTRIQDILDGAGTTKGGLYHHFTTKQEIADELVALEAPRWPTVIAGVAAVGARGLDAVVLLSHAIGATLRDEVRARGVLAVADSVAPARESTFELWRSAVIANLQQAIADGDVSDAISIRELGATLVDGIHGVCASPAPWAKETGVSERLDRFWAPVLRGVRAL